VLLAVDRLQEPIVINYLALTTDELLTFALRQYLKKDITRTIKTLHLIVRNPLPIQTQ
jgi:hypothetical protein